MEATYKPICEPISPYSVHDGELDDASGSGLTNYCKWTQAMTSGSSSDAPSTDSSPDTNWLSHMDENRTSRTDALHPSDQDLATTTQVNIDNYFCDAEAMINDDLMESSNLIITNNGTGYQFNQNSPDPDAQYLYNQPSSSEESAMLLQTLLQPEPSHNNINQIYDYGNCDLTEFRCAFSDPPMDMDSNTSSTSPTSSSTSAGSSPSYFGGETYYQVPVPSYNNNLDLFYNVRSVDSLVHQPAVPKASKLNVKERLRNKILTKSQPDTNMRFFNEDQTEQMIVNMATTTLGSNWGFANPIISSGQLARWTYEDHRKGQEAEEISPTELSYRREAI